MNTTIVIPTIIPNDINSDQLNKDQIDKIVEIVECSNMIKIGYNLLILVLFSVELPHIGCTIPNYSLYYLQYLANITKNIGYNIIRATDIIDIENDKMFQIPNDWQLMTNDEHILGILKITTVKAIQFRKDLPYIFKQGLCR